jgi:uncharacterized iron-regulated membrane protein
MIRQLFVLHRYLGIAVGALMAMWCLSGVVMMYVSYPGLQQSTRLKHLAPISWSGCCALGDALPADAAPVQELSIEMLGARPVLYRRDVGSSPQLTDLISGAPLGSISAAQAAHVAEAYVDPSHASTPRLLGLIDYDQWTVAGDFNADRPLYHFGLGDGPRTELYVSSRTGHVLQLTTGHERFWNWVGAVPHWLYFAQLRRNAWLWSQVVIVTALLGCFLAATGIYIGVRQLRRGPGGRFSPYRGFNLWHHVAGLIFGALALTWVLSGLLSINPWGWLEGAGSQAERARLQGPAIAAAQVRASIQALVNADLLEVVSISSAPLAGRLYLVASTAGGGRSRLDDRGAAAMLGDADLLTIAKILRPMAAPAVPELMTQEDAYYFHHHQDAAPLPVYRLASGDGSDTLYYIDPVSGDLAAKIDRQARGYRWWHQGLHRMDFLPALRARPQWDVLMLVLMSGVTVLCVSGAYLGYRRLVNPARASLDKYIK